MILVGLLIVEGRAMAEKIEEPEWRLLETLGDVELRHYGASVQATTDLRHGGESSRGFRRLAGFIFGGNDRAESIAMTAPVEETLGNSHPVMAFTMPAGYTADSLPRPDDDSVSIRELPERIVAVIEFSGWATPGAIKRHSAQLFAVLREQGIETVGEHSLNQYNPPWTPPFMRRNEIMVEVSRVEG